MEEKEEIISFKVLLLGDSTVGKTAFILRFCEDKFDKDCLTTLGLDTKNKFVKRGDKKILLNIWDTAGEERFRSITKNIFKSADGILLMYDISSFDTFKHIRGWINNIKEKIDIEKIAFIIVGNKCDLPRTEKFVDEESKKSFEDKNNIKIIEASAKDNINVNDCFITLIDKMLNLGLGKKKLNVNDDYIDRNDVILKNADEEKQNKDKCCGGGGGKKK